MTNKSMLSLAALVAALPSLAAAQETTITVWDEFGSEPMNGAMQKIVARCEAQVDGLKIERSTMPMEQMHTVLSTAIQSGKGPDVFYSSPGWSTVGPLIQSGAIADLTEAYDARGWRDRVQPWAADYVTYNGSVWALPYEAEIQGVFYHKDVFEEHGIAEPATYEEFIAAANKLREAGYDDPIVTAARPAYVLGWMESSMLGAIVPNDTLEAIVLDHQSWDQPAYREAVERINALYKDGLIPSGVLGYSYDDMMSLFYTKASPMVLTGSWIVPNIVGNFPDLEIGFFAVPPADGVQRRAPKASGGGFMLAGNSENRDLSLAYMDCLATPQSAQIWLSEGLNRAPIIGVDPEAAELSPLNRRVTEVVNEPVSAFNLYGILPSEVNNVTWNGIQAMWAGQMTPEALIEAKQEAWQRAIEAGEVIAK